VPEWKSCPRAVLQVSRTVGTAAASGRRLLAAADEHGRAVQVDPMKPKLKPPGTKRLKVKHDKSLSILLQFCFQFQLAPLQHGAHLRRPAKDGVGAGQGLTLVHFSAQLEPCLVTRKHPTPS